MTFLVRIRPFLTRARLRRPALIASGVTVVALVEVSGRRLAISDLHDLSAVPPLLVAVVALWLADRERPLSSTRGLSPVLAAVRGWVRALRCEVGVDLRGRPPLPRGVPRGYQVVGGAMLLLPVVILALEWVLPGGGRGLAAVSYVVHVAWLALRWAGVLVVAFGTGFLAGAVIHDWFVHRHRGPRRRRVRSEVLAVSVALAVVAAGMVLLPTWVPYALVLATAGGLLLRIWWPTTPEIRFVWRDRVPGAEIRRMSSRVVETFWAVILIGGFLNLLLLVHGSVDLGLHPPDGTLPVTEWIRRITAWVGATAIALSLAILHVLFSGLRRQDPSQPVPLTVHLAGVDPDREAVARMVRGKGWRVRPPRAPAEALDVRIEAVASPMPPLERPPRWPIRVSARALEVPELQSLLLERDVVQRRAAIRLGMVRLLRAARRRTYRRGSGFWIGPHQWFLAGMSRDEDEHAAGTDDPVIVELIGPPYARVFALPARSHLFEVLDRVEIDLFFLEDGVDTRSFLRVLDAVYRHHDLDGTRIEERHLAGIPGLRVMVHGYELEAPYRREGYPEPDYEDLGRARIVEIFRERHEGEELADVPMGVSSLLLTV